MPDYFEDLKLKAQKAALTGAMAAQSVMGMGVTPQAEISDDNIQTPPVEQTVSQQPQEVTDDILYGAFGQTSEKVATGNDALYDAFTQPTTESRANAEVRNPQEEYGFNINFSRDGDVGVLTQNNAENMAIDEKDINHQAWLDNYREGKEDAFAKDREYRVEHIDLYQHLQEITEGKTKEQIGNNLGLLRAAYDNEAGNTIIFTQYEVKPEDYDKCVDLLTDKLGWTREQATEKIDNVCNTTNLEKADFKTYVSTHEHEETHLIDDLKNGLSQYDIHPEYMARINMMTEVHANEVQAGLALDMYKATGTLDYFDELKVTIGPERVDTIKETLQKNQNMDNIEGFIAQNVRDGWLEKNNQSGTQYSEQAYAGSSPENTTYPLFALVKTPEAEKEYHRRVEGMFQHVEGLGDIRQYIDPDFKLNDDLQARLDADVKKKLPNENVQKLMTQNIAEGEYVSKDFTEYVQAVKDVYADGTKTAEESTRLGKILQDKLKTSEPLDVTKISEEDKAKIAALSGRSGKYQSPAQQTAEPQTLNRETKQASAMHQPASQTMQAPAAQEMPAPKAPSMEAAPNTQTAPEIKAPNTQTAPEIKAQSAEKAPNSTPAPQKQTVSELSPQEKGEFVHGLRNGRNMFLDRAEGKVTPTKDRSKVKAPQQNTVLNLKMQQQQTQRT